MVATLLVTKHLEFIRALGKDQEEIEYWTTEWLRISGIYWGLTAACIMKSPSMLPRQSLVEFVLSCMVEVPACGGLGFGGAPSHDPHLLYTLSAIQILAMLDELHAVDADKVAKYVASLQVQETGAFMGDEWGEIDSRFSYCALSTLKLVGKPESVDAERAIEFVLRCYNFDGGFGNLPMSESHAGQAFCCVGALYITGQLHRIDQARTSRWLCERQLPSGGLNGRPEKLEDVCYSWWVLSCLHMLGRGHWINRERLTGFILRCQDEENGGFSDTPGNIADVFHTLFGVAALSLMECPGLNPVSPAYCMPRDVISRLKL